MFRSSPLSTHTGFTCCFLLGILFAAAPAGAQTAGMLSFQGLLTDANGDPMAGPVDLEFRIFTAQAAGSLVDMDGDGVIENVIGQDAKRVTGVALADGVASTKFGPVFPRAFDGTSRWLEVRVGATTLPRFELVNPSPIAEQLNTPGTGTAAVTVSAAGNAQITNQVVLRAPAGSAANTQMDMTGGYQLFRDDTGAGGNNTRLWFESPNMGEIVLGPRAGANYLGNFRLRSNTMSFETAVGGANTLRILPSGNVGLNVAAPAHRLDVGGTINATEYRLNGNLLPNSQWITNGNNIYYANGNVGIGTLSPVSRLHVYQGADFPLDPTSVEARIQQATGENALFHSATASLRLSAVRDFFLGTDIVRDGLISVSNSENGAQQMNVNAQSANMSLTLQTQNNERMHITPGGNVGIATSTPTHLLDVNGAARFRGNTATNLLVTADFDDMHLNFVKNANTTPSARIAFNGYSDQNFHASDIEFYTRAPGNPNVIERLRIAEGGNVGVGTMTPGHLMHLRGGSPSLMIEDAATGAAFLRFNRAGQSGTHYIALGGGNQMFFNLNGTDRMVLTNNGLTVNGRTTTNVLEITGADLAEKFPVTEKVEPGMVVAIDPDHPGQLCLARGAYNRKVAGIVSGANNLSVGAILGNLPGHEDAPPIALSGRVWVHCDASSASIEPGDLLTTADAPGQAMKVIDFVQAQGAILGKAMTPLASGQGMVLVLVSLQ